MSSQDGPWSGSAGQGHFPDNEPPLRSARCKVRQVHSRSNGQTACLGRPQFFCWRSQNPRPSFMPLAAHGEPCLPGTAELRSERGRASRLCVGCRHTYGVGHGHTLLFEPGRLAARCGNRVEVPNGSSSNRPTSSCAPSPALGSSAPAISKPCKVRPLGSWMAGAARKERGPKCTFRGHRARLATPCRPVARSAWGRPGQQGTTNIDRPEAATSGIMSPGSLVRIRSPVAATATILESTASAIPACPSRTPACLPR